MKARKILVSLAALALVAAISIGGTLAYLTSTKSVKNTFTVGNIQMTLTETDITKDDGTRTARTDKGNEYKLYPGQTYTKDPQVTIVGGSEDCYVRMLVEVANIDKLKAAFPLVDGEGADITENSKYYAADGTFLIQYLCGDWNESAWPCTKVINNTTVQDSEGKDTQGAIYEFRFASPVAHAESDQTLPELFKTIIVPGTVDNTALALLGQVEINVIGNAVQMKGFESNVDAAWAAFESQN